MHRRLFLAGIAAVAAAAPAFAQTGGQAVPRGSARPDHAPWTALLQRYVHAGADGLNRVDYAGWRASARDRAALSAYIAALEAVAVSRLSRAEQFATWANLYNAVTVKEILDHYPVRSIRDIRSRGVGFDPQALVFGGPWKTKLVTVEGRRMSLDDIEHGVMRPTFADPRVHYSVNCASVGCPNLQREAFEGARLESQLDAGARAFVNSPRGVAVTPRGLRLSSIYDWFAEDFGDEAALRAHLARYASPDLASRLRNDRIVGYDYDWTLNDLTPARR